MTPSSFTWTLTCLFSVNYAPVTTLKQSLLNLKSVDAGDNVTLQCKYHDESAVMFFWYKQILAQKPQLMSSYYNYNINGSFHGEFNGNPRFSLDKKINLKISDVHISDSATYFCGSTNLENFHFGDGVTVKVKGSYLNVQTLVHLSEFEDVHPRDSVILNCTVQTRTCGGEHSIYWFTTSEEEQHPGVIYTHGGRNDQCKKKNDTETETHSCVHNLPLHSVDHTHDWTHCAVASCGRVLFGHKTRTDSHNVKESLVLIYFLSGTLAFTTTLVVLLIFSLYQLKKRSCQYTAASTVNNEDEQNLHYAALKYENSVRGSRTGRRQDDISTECVYSTVKNIK